MAGKHNFAPGSQRDSLVFGSSRPGFSKESEVPGGVNPADVANWCAFMKEQVCGQALIECCLGRARYMKYCGTGHHKNT
jgi:hypothetical protein